MYEVVAPILYDEPIVQNIGLFFLGVEQPSHGRNAPDDQEDIRKSEADNETGTKTEDDHSIPYHKRQLLDLVKKINFIRASSSQTIDEFYMENVNHEYKENDSYLNEMNCDKLGREDIEGLILAKSLLERSVEHSDSKLPWQRAFPLISFRHLTALTFGLWDDGRWAVYEDNANERIYKYNTDEPIYSDDDFHNRIAENDTSASAYMVCEEILSAFFLRTIVQQAVTLCHHAELGLRIFKPQSFTTSANRSNESGICPVDGLRVIHGRRNLAYDESRSFEHYYINAGPTRVFTKYSQGIYGYDDRPTSTADRMHQQHIDTFDDSIAAHMKRYPDRIPDEFHNDKRFRLEICVLPKTEGTDVVPEQAQIRTQIEQGHLPISKWTQKDKEASDAMARGSTKRRMNDFWRRSLHKRMMPFNIYAGDDVPACPGCGLKE
jgi:hypothetical protein